MRFVKTADVRPQRCAVIPFVGATHHAGFIDTGSELDGAGNHVYISLVALAEMCRVMEWPTPDEHQHLQSEVNRLAKENEALREQLVEADRFAESVRWTLGRFGEDVKNKPGRPRKQEAA